MATMTEDQLTEAINLVVKLHPNPATRADALLTLAGCDFETMAVLINSLKANLGMVSTPAPASFSYAPPAFVPPKGTYKVNGKNVQVKVGKSSGLPYFVIDNYYAGALSKPANAWAMDALSTPEKAEVALVAYAQETGKCGVCGKTLKDPESIAAGIGPVCKKNLYGSK